MKKENSKKVFKNRICDFNSVSEGKEGGKKNMEKKKFNTNAIFACIFSIISWFIFWWLGLVGASFGFKALDEIKQKGERGKALAIIGIVLGIAGVIAFRVMKYVLRII